MPSLWRNADFMRLWTGETISQLGTAVTFIALPLIAINTLHASSPQVGALTAVEFAPFLLVGLPAGVWVDRLSRKLVLVAGDVGRALVLATIPIAHAFDVLTIWQLYAVAFLTGVLTVFFDVAYQSYLPTLVERPQLADGNSKLEISRSGAQIAGPGIGGLIVGALTAPVALVVDAASFVLSGLAIVGIQAKEPRQRVAKADRPRMRTEIGEGLRYVFGHRLLRPIAMSTATSNLFTSMAQPVLMLYLVRELDFSATTIGLMFGLGNIGFLLGAALAPKITDRLGVGRTIVISMAIGGPGALLAPMASLGTPFAFVLASQFVFGLTGVVYNISQVSLRQSICPDRLLGRMNASMRFTVWGTMPIGAAIGGVLGGVIGFLPTLWLASAGACLAFIPPALSPVWRLRSISEAEAEEAALTAQRDGVLPPGAPTSGVLPDPS